MKYREVRLKIPTFEARDGGALVDEPNAAVYVASQFMQRENAPRDREVFGVLMLNARSKFIGASIAHVGTLTACMVHPREVFKAAIALGAAFIIVWHTHPSGEAEPSTEDHQLHTRLIEAGEIIGIPVVDGLVITANGFHSMGANAHNQEN